MQKTKRPTLRREVKNITLEFLSYYHLGEKRSLTPLKQAVSRTIKILISFMTFEGGEKETLETQIWGLVRLVKLLLLAINNRV